NGKDGLAFAHCLRSSGLQSLSADNSTYNTSESSPDNAASRLDVKTSPGSAGRGGAPSITTRPLGAAFGARTMPPMDMSGPLRAPARPRPPPQPRSSRCRRPPRPPAPHGRPSQDLPPVQHENGRPRETTTKATLTGTEQHTRTISELNSLRARTRQHAPNKRL